MTEEWGQWWSAFHFLRPWLLLLLIIPLWFYGRYFHGRNNQSSWEKVCDKKLLSYLLVKGSSTQRKVMAWLGMLGILTAILAAAGPSWIKVEIPALAPENPLMITLNLSSDMKGRDLTPTRLERAKFAIKDLLEQLQGNQIGLEVYSSEPFLIAPLTEDDQIIANLLPAVDFNIMPANGDRLDRAIALAVEKLQAAGFQQGNILVFTPDVGQRFDLALEAAKQAAAAGYKVNVAAAARQPNEKLQLVATAGNGKFFKLGSADNGLATFAQELNQTPGQLEKSKNWQSVWLDYGYYLLIVPLICCLYFFRRGIMVLVFLLAAHPADAGFFLNADQEGLKQFNQGNYEAAAQNFKDTRWKGATYYRLGDYEEAYRQFAGKDDVTSLYNQGNALAKGGKIEEAIKKYEEVLKLQPDHEDAKFNLDYLKRQQQQNQQQNQQNDQKNNSGAQKPQNQGENQQDEQNQPQQNAAKDGSEQEAQNQQQNGTPEENQPDQKQNPAQQPQNEPGKDEQNAANPQPVSGEDQKEEPREQPEQAGGVQKSGEEPEYDERMQARAQQYREIPEDPGGLLRAFIYREYQRNRYKDK